MWNNLANNMHIEKHNMFCIYIDIVYISTSIYSKLINNYWITNAGLNKYRIMVFRWINIRYAGSH